MWKSTIGVSLIGILVTFVALTASRSLAKEGDESLAPLSEYTVIDLTQPDWEAQTRQALVRAGHPDVERAIVSVKERKQSRAPGNAVKYVSVLPPGVPPPDVSDMSIDSYVNCGYNQNGWVMHNLSGYSQGYGFWQGTQWPLGTPWTNSPQYTYCDSAACLGIAHYWYPLRAPKTFSFTWDGYFSVADE